MLFNVYYYHFGVLFHSNNICHFITSSNDHQQPKGCKRSTRANQTISNKMFYSFLPNLHPTWKWSFYLNQWDIRQTNLLNFIIVFFSKCSSFTVLAFFSFCFCLQPEWKGRNKINFVIETRKQHSIDEFVNG